MKKSVFIIIVFVAMLGFGSGMAVADEVVPGAQIHVDGSVMGVGQTMMQMGASARAHTNTVIAKSANNYNVNPNTSFNADHQFGSSQTDQSWKAVTSVEEAPVRGLVAGDCQGDNSTDQYRKAMNQNRAGYFKEALVPNNVCGGYHATFK